jgi:hypothetical protein
LHRALDVLRVRHRARRGDQNLAAALHWRAPALCSKGLEAASLPIAVASTL